MWRPLARTFAGGLVAAWAVAAWAGSARAECAPAPLDECQITTFLRLVVDERRPGGERMVFSMGKMGPVYAPDPFGDPAGGPTRIDVCIYDSGAALAGAFAVDRGGARCGERPCWTLRDRPYVDVFSYRDPLAAADGVVRLDLRYYDWTPTAAIAGLARNRAAKGGGAFPTGLAGALAGETAVRLQLVVSDGICFDGLLDDVRRADGAEFRATQ